MLCTNRVNIIIFHWLNFGNIFDLLWTQVRWCLPFLHLEKQTGVRENAGRTWNMTVVSILYTWLLILYYAIVFHQQSFVPSGNCWWYFWKPSGNVFSVKENISFCKMPDPWPLLGPMSPGPPRSACLLSPSASPSERSHLFVLPKSQISPYYLISKTFSNYLLSSG